MHIPDGFLDAKTWISTTLLGGAVVMLASRNAQVGLKREQVPKMGLLGAFIFATQMVNFPIAGATSGHFLGGAMAAILFGPWVSVLLMSAVLIIQAFIFQDGGVTVLGANILCTGVLGSFAGYGMYRFLGVRGFQWLSESVKIFTAAWCSIVAAASGVSLLLALSGTMPLAIGLPAMTGWHSLIGIGEGLISVWVIAYWRKAQAVASPILVDTNQSGEHR